MKNVYEIFFFLSPLIFVWRFCWSTMTLLTREKIKRKLVILYRKKHTWKKIIQTLQLANTVNYYLEKGVINFLNQDYGINYKLKRLRQLYTPFSSNDKKKACLPLNLNFTVWYDIVFSFCKFCHLLYLYLYSLLSKYVSWSCNGPDFLELISLMWLSYSSNNVTISMTICVEVRIFSQFCLLYEILHNLAVQLLYFFS
jgi:hypothetical protein